MYVTLLPYAPTAVLEMLPLVGAVSAGHVVSAHAVTLDHVPLLWHVLMPPPQYPDAVVHVRLVVLLKLPASDEYVPPVGLVRVGHGMMLHVGEAALQVPDGQPVLHETLVAPVRL